MSVKCDCKCHVLRNEVTPVTWCENCFDTHVDFNKLMAQMDYCKRCGDGIPKKQMDEHLSWCMIPIASIKDDIIILKCNNNYHAKDIVDKFLEMKIIRLN